MAKKGLLENVKSAIMPGMNSQKEELELSCREAHFLWAILADRYIILERLNAIKNYAHDKDYILILETNINRFKKENKIVEKYMEMYSITPPQPNVIDINIIGNTEVEKDRVSSHLLSSYLRAETTILAQAIRDAIFNDNIRRLIKKFLKTNLTVLDSYLKFLKLKEWIAIPPAYKYLQPDIKEKVAINEIHYLWDHLHSRYTNIRLTQIAISFSNDIDIRLIFEEGLNILLNQADSLEKKLLNYGVTLPEPFNNITLKPESTEIIEDRFLYTEILDGMKNATTLHAISATEVITNDDLRSYFIRLTFEELMYVDNLIRYGKLKGYIPLPPKFNMGAIN